MVCNHSFYSVKVVENERFDKDFAVHDKQKRNQDMLTKEMIHEKHRLEALERDAKRWEAMEREEIRADQKQEYKKQIFLQGKHNMNG